jgi:hypothetical protein
MMLVTFWIGLTVGSVLTGRPGCNQSQLERSGYEEAAKADKHPSTRRIDPPCYQSSAQRASHTVPRRFDIYRHNARQYGEYLKQRCRGRGFVGLYPARQQCPFFPPTARRRALLLSRQRAIDPSSRFRSELR